MGNPDLANGRKNGDDDFTKWYTRVNGASLDNQVHSYAYAEFTPIKGGKKINTISNPQPIPVEMWSKTPLTTLGLKNDCYTVNIIQTDGSAINKNLYELSNRFAQMFMNAIHGRMGSESRNDCIAQIAGSIQVM